MKAYLLIFTILCSCKKEAQPTPENKPTPSYTSPLVSGESFDTAWLMDTEYKGHMGVALAFHDSNYYQWMYSDVGEHTYTPLSGSFTVKDNIITLGPPKNSESRWHMVYTTQYQISVKGLKFSLIPMRDGVAEVERTYRLITEFDPKSPFDGEWR